MALSISQLFVPCIVLDKHEIAGLGIAVRFATQAAAIHEGKGAICVG